MSDNADIAWIYIDIIYCCFEVGVADEVFSFMEQVNPLLTIPSLLAKAKSLLSDKKKFIEGLTSTVTYAANPVQVQLVLDSFAKLQLSLPPEIQHLLLGRT